MRKIAFLHTADAHIAAFDALFEKADPTISRTHAAHPEWLDVARDSGLTEDLYRQVGDVLNELAGSSDAVLCTCSTVGPIADQVSAAHPNVFRIDRPLMEKAAQHNGKIMVAICVESTLKPTLDLLIDVFAKAGKTLDHTVVRCDAAWPHFWSGDQKAFGNGIANEVKRVFLETTNPSCVLLAQASMAAAEPYLSDLGVPVYASPSAARDTILRTLNTD